MPFKITSVMALATLVGAAAAASSPMTTNENPAEARRLTESFEFIDCYEDGTSPRIMGNPAVSAPGVMTTEMCASNCTGSSYFGTQYSHECFCGDENTVFEYYGTSSDCIMPCDGDSADICGGGWAMSVYEYTDLSGLPATPVPTPVPVPTLPPAGVAPTPEPIAEPPTGVPPAEPIEEPLEDDEPTDTTTTTSDATDDDELTDTTTTTSDATDDDELTDTTTTTSDATDDTYN